MPGSGYGAGPWGGVPWGGSIELGGELIPEELCDLFLYEDCDSMLNILVSPIIEATGDSEQFAVNYPDPPPPPSTTCDLGILSGELGNGAFSTKNAYITAVPPAGIDDVFTVEINVLQEELPADFTDLANKHFAFGVTDTTGVCAAVFVSKAGLAYTGAFHHSPPHPSAGTLILDGSLQIIPGTAPFVLQGEYVTYRLAVSGLTGAAYLYATRTADLGGGHQLVAVLPSIDASELVTAPVQDRAVISVRGTTSQPTRVSLDRWCLSSELAIANLLPVANAGQDQAIRLCSLARLDGSASFDPEGASLLYHWRLINAPSNSSFSYEGTDGYSYPEAIPTGSTNRLYSASLATEHAADPVLAGDVLLHNAVAWSIDSVGFDPMPGRGFYVQLWAPVLPDNLTSTPFKILRQRGLTNPDTVAPSFFPDVAGFYTFDLTVFDGALYSEPSVVSLSVQESVLPVGCTPSADFLSDYLSDFWTLVEDAEIFGVFWSAMAQVTATELYTLWQHEYSKSIRDIQRTITRRWLHYDLMLEEPVPEETEIRSIWSGVSSSAIDATVGVPAMSGTTLVLESSAAEPITVDLTGVVYANELILALNRAFRINDDRYSAELIADAGSPVTFYVVRIDAPFAFSIGDGTTCPVFTIGDTSGTLYGTGAAAAINTYAVDRSLQGSGVEENDLLVIDGIGYRISHIASDDTGTDVYPLQRVVVKDPLPVTVGGVWSIPSLSRSRRLDFYAGLVSAGDHAFYEIDLDGDNQIDELIEVQVLGAAENLSGSLPIDATPLSTYLADPGASVRLAKIVRRTYLPISNLIVGVPFLHEKVVIEDEEAVLRENLDFFVEDYRGHNALRFVAGVDTEDDVWEGDVPPTRLWAEYTYVDNSPVIEANFGLPADLSLDDLAGLPTQVDYLSALRGLWYAYLKGPSVFNVRVGAQIFLGLPFAEGAGTIIEIREDFSPNEGRLLIQDDEDAQIIRSYRYPVELELEVNPATGERYAVGDTVEQFAPLVEGVEVRDYIDDPAWFRGALNQGIFSELQKYHTFQVRVDSDVFDLDALLLTQRMVLRIKPTWKNLAYVVSLELEVDDIDVTDQVEMEGALHLFDAPCPWQPIPVYNLGCPAPVYQASPNTAYGQYCNQYNDTPAPLKYNQDYLRPEEELSADVIQTFAGSWTPKYDGLLKYNGNETSLVQFVGTGPFVVTTAGISVPAKTTGLVAHDGDITWVRLVLFGGPGSDPTDYEFVVEVNSVEKVVVPFDANDEFVEKGVELSVPISTLYLDAVAFKVRIPAGSISTADRNPDWTLIWGNVTVEGGAWVYNGSYAAGTFINRHRPL